MNNPTSVDELWVFRSFVVILVIFDPHIGISHTLWTEKSLIDKPFNKKSTHSKWMNMKRMNSNEHEWVESLGFVFSNPMYRILLLILLFRTAKVVNWHI